MRKISTLCAILSCAWASVPVHAAIIEYDNIRYEVSKFAGRPTEEAIMLGFCNGYEPQGEFAVPSAVEYDGQKLPVVGIGLSNYSGHEDDEAAIGNCKGITAVRIPKCIRFIGKMEFFGCPNIERYIVEDGCEEYRTYENSLLEKIYSTDEERWTFFRYPSAATAQTFAVPSIAERVHTGAFAANTSLKKIYLSGDQRLDAGWQLDNRSIDEVDCSNSKAYSNGPLGAVYYGSALKAVCPGRRYETFIVPDFVTVIDEGVFCNSDIGHILIHSEVRNFADRMTFMNSTVESVDYPDAAAPHDVWDNCFSGCRNLKSIKLAGNASGHLDIYVNAFRGCESLEEVTLVGEVKSMKINLCSFMGCSSLKSFPVTSKMKVQRLGERAFSGCRSLESFPMGIVEEFSEYGYQFDGTGLKAANWPSAFPQVPRGIFMNCTELDKVDLKTTTDKLYWDAFRGSGLTAVNMSGVTDWYTTTFADCPNLIRLYFPNVSDNTVYYTQVPFMTENPQVVVNHDHIRGLDRQTATYSDKAALYLSETEGGIEIGDGWREVLVPGQSAQIYRNLTASPVEEMFSYSTFPEKKAVEIKAMLPEVKISSVTIEGVEAVLTDGLWVAESAAVKSGRMNVIVNYKVSNCPMTSRYSYLYSGVDEIASIPDELPVEWFTLDGIRTVREGLSPGIYIRRQGTRMEKVVVR